MIQAGMVPAYRTRNIAVLYIDRENYLLLFYEVTFGHSTNFLGWKWGRRGKSSTHFLFDVGF